LAEVGRYRERVIAWADWGLAGPEALADYARFGWRVRLLGVDDLPQMRPAAERLITQTPRDGQHTLWWSVVPDPGAPWRWLLAAAARANASTREAAIRALYGEDIPPGTLYLGFGKPMVAPDLVPPLLGSEMQCYWPQRPGYELDEEAVRRIFYDYAYLRRTWSANRGGRYDNLERQRAAWETRAVLGVGQRLGDFWYPTSFPDLLG
jgi:hypothetical protein